MSVSIPMTFNFRFLPLQFFYAGIVFKVDVVGWRVEEDCEFEAVTRDKGGGGS